MQQQQPTCEICGDPTYGYVCERDINVTRAHLVDVCDLAGEVETTVARLARYATRGGRRAVQVDEDDAPGPANRRNIVEAFGWPASKDRPKPGALRETALPVDLHASSRAAVAFNVVTTWARLVSEERGLDIRARPDDHPVSAAAWFLRDQLDWLRHQRFAAEACDELRAAGATIKRVVDAPPEMQVVGVCDCGTHLYAYRGASVVTCADCSARWDVQASRQSLMDALRDRLVTAAEGATLVALVHPDLQRAKVRNMIRTWAARGHLLGTSSDDGARYLFGEVIDRVSQHVAAGRGRDRATVTAIAD